MRGGGVGRLIRISASRGSAGVLLGSGRPVVVTIVRPRDRGQEFGGAAVAAVEQRGATVLGPGWDDSFAEDLGRSFLRRKRLELTREGVPLGIRGEQAREVRSCGQGV